MKSYGLIAVVLFAFIATTYSEPEAEPEPSALAEADASVKSTLNKLNAKNFVKPKSRCRSSSCCGSSKKCKKSGKKSTKNKSKRPCTQCITIPNPVSGVPGGTVGNPGSNDGSSGSGSSGTGSSGNGSSGSGSSGSGSNGNGSSGNGSSGSGSSGNGSSGSGSAGDGTNGSGSSGSGSNGSTGDSTPSSPLLDYCQYNCSDSANIGCGATNTVGPNCPSGATIYVFNNDDINLMLSLANQARNNIASGSVSPFQAANEMPTMTWNAPLAQLAQYNAQQCNGLQHDQCHNTDIYNRAGQNIGYIESSSGYGSISDAITNVHNQWYNEHNSASMDNINSYPQNQPTDISHFTQMVRAKSPTMGCAASRYLANGLYRTQIVCDYASTNTYGAPVYETGNACSNCNSGCSSQYTALCNSNENVDVNSTT